MIRLIRINNFCSFFRWCWFAKLFMLTLLIAKTSQQYESNHQYQYLYPPDNNMLLSAPPVQDSADDRTFISDIIGFSAFKLMIFFAIPMLFSVFLGAMLVLLFPFPLLTSTTGLAGAAAVGRRQGRVAETEEMNDVLQLLGIPDPPLNGKPTSTHHHTRVKKQFKTLPKMKRLKILSNYYAKNSTPDVNAKKDGSGEDCVQRIACEIGRENKDVHSKAVMNKIIDDLQPTGKRKWKPIIQAYLDGIQSQSVVLISESPNPPQTIGPVYRHNLCLKYKCSL